MKVIYCGFSKCGTTSMAEAFRKLGLNCHDFLEHFYDNGEGWQQVCEGTFEGNLTDHFRNMMSGVDALSDIPAFFFWEEVLEAFPDVKVISSNYLV